jgi:hypothetical protein
VLPKRDILPAGSKYRPAHIVCVFWRNCAQAPYNAHISEHTRTDDWPGFIKFEERETLNNQFAENW